MKIKYRSRNSMFESTDELIDFISKRADCFSLTDYYGDRKLTQTYIDEALLLEQKFSQHLLDHDFLEAEKKCANNPKLLQDLLIKKQDRLILMDKQLDNIRRDWEELLHKQKNMEKFYDDNCVFEDAYYKVLEPFLIKKYFYPPKKYNCYFAYYFEITSETVGWLKKRKNIFDLKPEFPQLRRCALECLTFYRNNAIFAVIDDESHVISMDLNDDEIEKFENIGKGYIDCRKKFVKEFEADKKTLSDQEIVNKYVAGSEYPNHCFYIKQNFIESDLNQAPPYEDGFYKNSENQELLARILVKKGLSKLSVIDVANLFFWVRVLPFYLGGEEVPGSRIIYKFLAEVPKDIFISIFTQVVNYSICVNSRSWAKNIVDMFFSFGYSIDDIEDKNLKNFLYRLYSLLPSARKFSPREEMLFQQYKRKYKDYTKK